jgi:hypothetical protein
MSHNFWSGFLVGLLASVTLGARKTGEKPVLGKSIQIKEKNNNCWHIHHWMYLIPVTYITSQYKNYFITGFFSALIIHGIFAYNDSLRINVPCQN